MKIETTLTEYELGLLEGWFEATREDLSGDIREYFISYREAYPGIPRLWLETLEADAALGLVRKRLATKLEKEISRALGTDREIPHDPITLEIVKETLRNDRRYFRPMGAKVGDPTRSNKRLFEFGRGYYGAEVISKQNAGVFSFPKDTT